MRFLPLLVLAILAATREPGVTMAGPDSTEAETPGANDDRVSKARTSRSAEVSERFARAGVPYPPAAIFLRVFKHERELELWARPSQIGPFRRVHVHPILASSGVLGPKRQEGDKQVPEGVYRIDRFNPRSLFHLSLGLDYPNASDLARTTAPAAPGSDIFIHGGDQSAGCLAMGDAAIEELYLAALDARDRGGQSAVPVHVFPCRMTPENWRGLLIPLAAHQPGLAEFWRELQAVDDAFERAKVPPDVTVEPDGRYRPD